MCISAINTVVQHLQSFVVAKNAVCKCMKGKKNAKYKKNYKINVISVTLRYVHLLI